MAAGEGLPGGCSPWGPDPGGGSPVPAASATETHAASLPSTHPRVGTACAHVCPDLAGWGGKSRAWSWQCPLTGYGLLRAVSHCAAWEANGQ